MSTNIATETYSTRILYDDGQNRITYHRQHQAVQTIVLTFDHLNVTWDTDSFGLKFLQKQGVDIIAVEKKEKKKHYQTLSREDYLKSVIDIVQLYSHRIAYGSSLGAYAALYYTPSLHCRILAFAPRIPLHPVYGLKKE